MLMWGLPQNDQHHDDDDDESQAHIHVALHYTFAFNLLVQITLIALYTFTVAVL